MNRNPDSPDIKTDTSLHPEENFLVGEDTDNVDASGVDDDSTGKQDDFLGKTNTSDEAADQD
ncbi:hypothetical protein GCM10027578_36080 [Spirosoma luteolum]